MSFTLRYRDFWPGFSANGFLFTDVIQSIFPKQKIKIIKDSKTKVDLEICSVFTYESHVDKLVNRSRALVSEEAMNEYTSRSEYGFRPSYKTLATKRVWFTGENLRPPVGLFDGTISFDPDDYRENNVYFPLFLFGIDWFNKKSSPNGGVSRDAVANRRPLNKAVTLSACSFASNRSPSREKLIKNVELILQVDQFGKSVGKRVESKLIVSSDYTFQICNENSMFPGYVTEKLIEAWQVGNIPIWTGLTGNKLDLNLDGILDFTGLNSEEIEFRLRGLDRDSIEEKLQSPLMNTPPTLRSLEDFFRKTI